MHVKHYTSLHNDIRVGLCSYFLGTLCWCEIVGLGGSIALELIGNHYIPQETLNGRSIALYIGNRNLSLTEIPEALSDTHSKTCEYQADTTTLPDLSDLCHR
jgi:hypothetical protein